MASIRLSSSRRCCGCWTRGTTSCRVSAPTAWTGGAFKRWTSGGFYQLLNLISGTHVMPGAADFRALSRQAVDALNSMPEYHRFLRGMISWMGYSSVILPYSEPRRLAGKSKYSFGKMLQLALDAVFSFSLAPLYVGLSLGGVLLCLAAVEMIYVLSFWITGRTSGLAPGWSSLMFVVLIVGGMLMVLLGFVGVYVGYIFQEVKRRPVFLARKRPRRRPEPIQAGLQGVGQTAWAAAWNQAPRCWAPGDASSATPPALESQRLY